MGRRSEQQATDEPPLVRLTLVRKIIDRISSNEIALRGAERDKCIFWLGGAAVAKDKGTLLLLKLVVERQLTLPDAQTMHPLKWIGAVSYFQALDGIEEPPEVSLEKWRNMNATEREVLLDEYIRQATKLGGPLNPRREPFPQDLARLRTGAKALELGEPTTVEEIKDQLAILHPALAAMQSLDDLGTDIANAKALRDMYTLQDKYKRLEKRLEEET
jgi:hypothetical protein